MSSFILRICAETPDYHDAVERLAAEAFGPGRFARAAFRLREGVAHEDALSFIALLDEEEGPRGELVGSVRLTRILVGAAPALVLGPLVVVRSRKNLGIGRELMNRAIHEARRLGHRFIILVGDLPYYAKFGFQRVPEGRITLPGPADPARVLYCELEAGALRDYSGSAQRHVR